MLVHGAGSGPWVFDAWRPRWAGFDVRVPDLHAGLDVARATMGDYVDRVLAAAWPRPDDDAAGTDADPPVDGPVVLCGWSMGGLVAMMAVARRAPDALVVVEPSVPAEVGGHHPAITLEAGTYGAAEAYGAVAAPNQSRPESVLARRERKRGISVPRVPCPMLVVSGRDHGAERGRPVAERYGADLLEFPGLGHSDLVTDTAVADDVVAWVRGAVPVR